LELDQVLAVGGAEAGRVTVVAAPGEAAIFDAARAQRLREALRLAVIACAVANSG
jgi:hypothetical protein